MTIKRHTEVEFFYQVQDKFVLHLTDEEAVAYLQNLIDESVSAMMAALVEQIHKMAQVTLILPVRYSFILFKETVLHALQ